MNGESMNKKNESVICPICWTKTDWKHLVGRGWSKEEVMQLVEAGSNGELKIAVFTGIHFVKTFTKMGKPSVEVLEFLKDFKKGLLDSLQKINKDNKGDMKDTLEDKLKPLYAIIPQFTQVIETLGELKGNKTEIGITTQENVARKIRRIKNDLVDIRNRGSEGIDLVVTVIENNKELGKIIIEVKFRNEWRNDYLKQAERYRREENTRFVIIATKTMPKFSEGKLWIFKDGIWIVPLDVVEYAFGANRKAMIDIMKSQKRFSKQLLNEKNQQKIVEKLEEIMTSKDFEEEIIKTKTEAQEGVKVVNRYKNYTIKKLGKIEVRFLNIVSRLDSMIIKNKAIKEKWDELRKIK